MNQYESDLTSNHIRGWDCILGDIYAAPGSVLVARHLLRGLYLVSPKAKVRATSGDQMGASIFGADSCDQLRLLPAGQAGTDLHHVDG